MSHKDVERLRSIKLKSPGIEVFSIYNIQFDYEAAGDYPAAVTLVTDSGKLINQFIAYVTFKKGKNTASINIVSAFYGKLDTDDTKNLNLHILATGETGFMESLPLSSTILTPSQKESFFKIDTKTLTLSKLFDIRVQASQPKYLIHGLKDPNANKTRPIILHGFYNKEDGLGAHLPNLYETVFNDYKTISFSRQTDRFFHHFSFLSREPDCRLLALPKYDNDFKWMNFYYITENLHNINISSFKNCAFIHVGGVGIQESEQWESKLLFENFKNKYNASTYLYLMWESDNISALSTVIDSVDNIIVTNNWLKTVINKQFPKKTVYVVEHIAKYHYEEATPSDDIFTFGTSSGLWTRKNVDILIKAYNEIKTSDTVLKIHSREFANTPLILEPIISLLEKDKTGIEFINQTLKTEEYQSWWKSLHCYVFISSGESYSITPRQALLQGTPVILSQNTAHLDLSNVPGILWVPCNEKRKADFSGNPGLKVDVGEEFAPSEQDVISAMQEVRNNYTYWKQQAELGRDVIKDRVDPKKIKKQWDMLLV